MERYGRRLYNSAAGVVAAESSRSLPNSDPRAHYVAFVSRYNLTRCVRNGERTYEEAHPCSTSVQHIRVCIPTHRDASAQRARKARNRGRLQVPRLSTIESAAHPVNMQIRARSNGARREPRSMLKERWQMPSMPLSSLACAPPLVSPRVRSARVRARPRRATASRKNRSEYYLKTPKRGF